MEKETTTPIKIKAIEANKVGLWRESAQKNKGFFLVSISFLESLI